MTQLPLVHTRPPFCAYAGGACDQPFDSITGVKGLFLFGSRPSTIAATILTGANRLADEDGPKSWATWKDMEIAGRMIFCEICMSMRGATTIYADVTTLNFNLLFEIGFAIGLGVPVRPIRDPTYSVDKRAYDSLGILDTLGYIDFTNADELVTRVRNAEPLRTVGDLPKRIYRETPLYVLKGPIDTDGSVRLISLLNKSRLGYRAHDPRENPRLPLHQARKQVSGSFGVVAHLLSPNREGATVHNALSAVVAGMAVAEQKPVVLIQEEHVGQPIDYRDLVRSYERADQIEKLIEEPLTQVVGALQTGPETGSTPRVSSLLALDLGDMAAENEITGLRDYFVRTGKFGQVRQGHAQIVVGRKGSGKTATFYGLRHAVRGGRDVLVLDMKPEGHQFTRLREAILQSLSAGQREYVIAAFWTYLLSAEVAHKILNDPGELRAAERDPERYAAYKRLEDAYLAHGLASGDDLSQRLLRQIDRMAARFSTEGEITGRSDLTELVYGGDIRTLNDAVAEYLIAEKEEVWLLIDNLDKSWATRGSTEDDMTLLRGLLDAAQRLRRQLEKRDVDFRAVVFVRTDILEHLTQVTPDRGKDAVVRLDWDDDELFREIVRRRIVHSTRVDGNFESAWGQIAPTLIGIEDGFNYMIGRTLRRPRDLLMFLQAAVQVAIDRGHDRILAEDVQQAESGYSEDMLINLVYEIEDTRPEMADAVYGFHGAPQAFELDFALDVLQQGGVRADGTEDALDLLLWYGFLGVRMHNTADEQYSFSVRYNVRRLKNALATRTGALTVHPAFRPALSVVS